MKELFNNIPSIILVLLLVVLYIISVMIQANTNRKKIKEFQKNLKIGDYVMLTSGILGTIIKINYRYIDLKISENTIIKIDKYSVTSLIDSTEFEKEL